jgi:hypothetical protein
MFRQPFLSMVAGVPRDLAAVAFKALEQTMAEEPARRAYDRIRRLPIPPALTVALDGDEVMFMRITKDTGHKVFARLIFPKSPLYDILQDEPITTNHATAAGG